MTLLFAGLVGATQNEQARWVLIAVTVFVAAVIAVVIATRNKRRDSETRCRKCQYILRGISEPRCPECGERI